MLLVTMLLDYVSSSDFKTTITWPYGHLVGHLYGGSHSQFLWHIGDRMDYSQPLYLRMRKKN